MVLTGQIAGSDPDLEQAACAHATPMAMRAATPRDQPGNPA